MLLRMLLPITGSRVLYLITTMLDSLEPAMGAKEAWRRLGPAGPGCSLKIVAFLAFSDAHRAPG